MIILHYHQPYITSYRREVVDALATSFDVHVFADVENYSKLGFESIEEKSCVITHAPTIRFFAGKLQFQTGILSKLIKERPRVLLLCANPRLISFWLTLIIARCLRLRSICHGQAMFGHSHPGKLRIIMYKLMLSLSNGYICYSQKARNELLKIGCRAEKVFVADNSVSLDAVVNPDDRSYSADGVLFMGRLRKGSDILRLIEAMKKLNSTRDTPVALHVIGGGEMEGFVRDHYSDLDWLTLHGAVFDDWAIANISLKCRLGAYTGDAGLSVVHYFGLALPVLVHSSINDHMGPEPDYVNASNGFLFDRCSSVDCLALLLADIFSLDTQDFQSRGKSAFDCYRKLNSPTLGRRLTAIIESFI